MAHLLDSMFSVRQMPWHGLGTILSESPKTWAEAQEAAGLNWEPTTEPVYRKLPDGTFTEISDSRLVSRSDRPNVELGVVSEAMSKSLYPNADLGPLVEAFQDGGLVYETAGSLDEGRKVWVLVRAAEPFVVPGDPNGAVLPFLAVQNNHDGMGSLRIQRLETRIVCANTSNRADREAARHGCEYVFKHTETIKNRVEIAKQAINGLAQDRVDYLAWANDLMSITLSPRQVDAFVEMFIPMPVAEVISERVQNNINEARAQLRGIFDGITSDGIKSTAYGAVQGAIEFLDHSRKARNAETKFRRCMLSSEPMKRQAERFARQAALV